jgi:hypothetical protein
MYLPANTFVTFNADTFVTFKCGFPNCFHLETDGGTETVGETGTQLEAVTKLRTRLNCKLKLVTKLFRGICKSLYISYVGRITHFREEPLTSSSPSTNHNL